MAGWWFSSAVVNEVGLDSKDNQRAHTFSEEQKIQSLESQTFLKCPFLASPRIVSAVVSGGFENPNSQCRADARRSQEIPSGSPHSCVGFGGLVVGAKSKIFEEFIQTL
jgi:hypothetical protein